MLDSEQVDQGFVDDGMGIVPRLVQEAAKGIFQGTCIVGVDMRLDGGEVDDVLSKEVSGIRMPLGNTLSSTNIGPLGS